MTLTTLNLRVHPYRLLTKAEAAFYCRISLKKFAIQCPVKPIEVTARDFRWDVQDLDKWIDSLKSSNLDESADSIVARLE
jgi:hypothetical protein